MDYSLDPTILAGPELNGTPGPRVGHASLSAWTALRFRRRLLWLPTLAKPKGNFGKMASLVGSDKPQPLWNGRIPALRRKHWCS